MAMCIIIINTHPPFLTSSSFSGVHLLMAGALATVVSAASLNVPSFPRTFKLAASGGNDSKIQMHTEKPHSFIVSNRFGWFQNADNPSVSFKEVTCPAELTKKTGCSRS